MSRCAAMNDSERSARQYDAMAAEYAADNAEGAHNAYYERPATISLLGEVTGLRVPEVGCGAGPLTAWLVDHGAIAPPETSACCSGTLSAPPVELPLAQRIPFGTTAWRRSMYRRQVVESTNAALKGSFADMSRGFFRVFGLVKISVILGVTLAAYNLERVRSFRAQASRGSGGTPAASQTPHRDVVPDTGRRKGRRPPGRTTWLTGSPCPWLSRPLSSACRQNRLSLN